MNIAILWYGVEWSSTYNFLTQKKWISPSDITLLDKNTEIEIPKWAKSVLWESYLTDVTSFDQIRRSPWFTNHKLEQKVWKDTFDNILPKLISQTSYFFQHYSGTTIAVTWTKWKSTTVSFLKTLLGLWKKSVKLVWNIWTPVLEAVDFANEPDIVIYEVSSYMLEDLWDRKHPDKASSFDIWILTSLSEAHAGSHGWLNKYISAKMKIISQSSMSYISNQAADSEYLPENIKKILEKKRENWTWTIYGVSWSAYIKQWSFYHHGKKVCSDQDFAPLWEHMRWNVSVWLLLLHLNNVTHEDFKKALALYQPLPHRLEDIWTYKQIKRYNDSFASTCHSVEACISTLWDDLETLFVWWYDNLSDITSLIQKIHQSSLKNIIIFPTTWERIKNELSKNLSKSYNILETDDIQEAIQRAYTHTSAWKSAALSCGFPSFTMWNNYVHRWENFTELVKKIWNS